MICSICEEVSQVPTDTRIPTAYINNTLWDRRLESGLQRELDLSPRGSAAACQADGNSRGGHLPREQWIICSLLEQFLRVYRPITFRGRIKVCVLLGGGLENRCDLEHL
jgi:hypothetical protein